MDGEDESHGTVRRSGGQNPKKSWGASDALRRNYRSESKSGETSPLLAGGSGSTSEDGRSSPTEWSGYADYKGLSRWRTPSVHMLASM